MVKLLVVRNGFEELYYSDIPALLGYRPIRSVDVNKWGIEAFEGKKVFFYTDVYRDGDGFVARPLEIDTSVTVRNVPIVFEKGRKFPFFQNVGKRLEELADSDRHSSLNYLYGKVVEDENGTALKVSRVEQ
jgi:hypothetical protein